MEALIGCSSKASRMGGISEIQTSCLWSGGSKINFRHIPRFSIVGGPKTLMGDQRAGRLKKRDPKCRGDIACIFLCSLNVGDIDDQCRGPSKGDKSSDGYSNEHQTGQQLVQNTTKKENRDSRYKL